MLALALYCGDFGQVFLSCLGMLEFLFQSVGLMAFSFVVVLFLDCVFVSVGRFLVQSFIYFISIFYCPVCQPLGWSYSSSFLCHVHSSSRGGCGVIY